jgi:hypothetical protein
MKVARQVWHFWPKKSKAVQSICKLWSFTLGCGYIYHLNPFINQRIRWWPNRLRIPHENQACQNVHGLVVTILFYDR